MINGSAYEFVDELAYQDHYAEYQGKKFYFNGCQCNYDINGNLKYVVLEVYNLTNNELVFSTKQKTVAKCIEAFEKAALWGGKTFWQIEHDIEWVDA